MGGSMAYVSARKIEEDASLSKIDNNQSESVVTEEITVERVV
jgi:hypothetical protein